VFLATSQTVEAALPLADELALDGVVGTELEAEDGVYTGRFVGGYCYGPRKAAAVERFCATRGIDLAASWFYTDAVVDLPLLERVGNPVVVNPEKPLARIAIRRGWARLAFA
jgi:phosphoserine phosphatase